MSHDEAQEGGQGIALLLVFSLILHMHIHRNDEVADLRLLL